MTNAPTTSPSNRMASPFSVRSEEKCIRSPQLPAWINRWFVSNRRLDGRHLQQRAAFRQDALPPALVPTRCCRIREADVHERHARAFVGRFERDGDVGVGGVGGRRRPRKSQALGTLDLEILA